MATEKTRAPRQFDSLPATYDGVRFKGSENEKHLTFVKTPLKKKKKDGPDRFALVPQRPKNDADMQQLMDFGGLKLVGESFLRFTRQVSQRWTMNAFDASSGLFVPDEYAKMVDKFSARGETIKALREELDELQDEMIDLSKDTTVDAGDKMKRFNEIVERMKEVKEAIEFRTATADDEDEEDDTTNGVAKATV